MTLAADGRYSMMTMDTGSELLHVPVDMQAASKIADEKRKRNAAASHSFRQRRKAKERETTKKFSELEQKIRELEEERDYCQARLQFCRNQGKCDLIYWMHR